MKRLGVTCAALVVAAVAASCGTAHEGSPCQAGGPQCQDEQTALFCNDGFYRAIPCRGGCTAITIGGQPVIECDTAGNVQSGDECTDDFTGLVFQCEPLPGADGGFQAEVCGGDIWRLTVCPTACSPGEAAVGEVSDPGTCE